jgi:anti-sigma28 factor (negative regulator of flagellin synthesis)
MKISGAEIRSVLAAYRSARRTPQTLTAIARAQQRWGAVRIVAAAGRRAQAKPFYRDRLVTQLRRSIAEGRYAVSGEEIADKLLGRLIVDAASA